MDLLKKSLIVDNIFTTENDISIINGDVIKEIEGLPDDFFTLIISSPPYNMGKSYETKEDLDSYLIWQEAVISKLIAKLKDDGSICWQVGNYIKNKEVYPLDIYLYPVFKRLGLQLRNRIIWHFNHGLHASIRFSGRYETLLWFSKNDNYIFNLDNIRVPSKYPGKRHYKGIKKGLPSGNPQGKNPSDFWHFIYDEFEKGIIDIPNVKANHPEKTSHPCQFPVELIERCILAFTNQDSYVLDPFAGSGTTAIAAIKQDRKAVLIEKELDYCTLAYKRINDFQEGKLKTRAIGTMIHEPSQKDKVAQKPAEWLL